MVGKERYSSVSRMLADMVADSTLRDEFEQYVGQRRIVKYLVALRAARGVTQKAIANRLGCSQSRISKMENGVDNDLRLGDLREYLAALNLDLRLVLVESGHTAVDEIRWHAVGIKRLLDRLATLAGDDETMVSGVSRFIREAFFNIVRLLSESADKLPSPPRGRHPDVQIEMCESDPGIGLAELGYNEQDSAAAEPRCSVIP